MYCFGVFCRICLEPKGNMSNIDGFCNGIHIGEMIFTIKKELLNLDRLLPDLICEPCKIELEISYKFHKKCGKSMDTLNDFVKKLNPQKELFPGPDNYTSHLEYFGLGSNITSRYRRNFENNEFAYKSYNQRNSRSLLFKIKRLRKQNNRKKFKSRIRTEGSSNFLSDLSEFSKSNSNCSKTTVRLENLEDVEELTKKSNFIYDKKYLAYSCSEKSDENSNNSSEKSLPIGCEISSSNSTTDLQTIPISYSPVNDIQEDEIDEALDLELGETSLNNNVSEYNRIKEEISNNFSQSDIPKTETLLDCPKSPQKLNIISHEIVPCNLKFNLDLMEDDMLDIAEKLKVEKDDFQIKEENLEAEIEEFAYNDNLTIKSDLFEIEEHDLAYTLEDAKFFKQELLLQKEVDNLVQDTAVKTTEIVEKLNNKTTESLLDKTDNVSATKEAIIIRDKDKSSPVKEETPRPLLSFLHSRFLCKYCDTPCRSALGLKMHIYKFHFSKFNECHVCSCTFRTRSELLEHVRIKGHGQRQYFKSKRNYDYNLFNNSAHVSRRSYTCRVCKQVFWSQFEFGHHTRYCIR